MVGSDLVGGARRSWAVRCGSGLLQAQSYLRRVLRSMKLSVLLERRSEPDGKPGVTSSTSGFRVTGHSCNRIHDLGKGLRKHDHDGSPAVPSAILLGMKVPRAPALIVMCGLSFSGKSTLAAQLAVELAATVISLDAINAERDLYGGQGIPITEWAKTNRIAHERSRTLLSTGHTVIIDDTGSPRFIRDQWRDTANAEEAAFALVWIQIDPKLQRARLLATRSAHDRHDVTDEVLREHVAGFEPPSDEGAIMIGAGEVLDPERVDGVADRVRAIIGENWSGDH